MYAPIWPHASAVLSVHALGESLTVQHVSPHEDNVSRGWHRVTDHLHAGKHVRTHPTLPLQRGPLQNQTGDGNPCG